MSHLIGKTRNDIAVYVDLIGSDAAKHIAQRPHLMKLAAEVLKTMSPRGATASIEYDMGRPIGYDFVVATPADAGDAVFYAQIAKDTTYTRFIKNQKPKATQSLSVMLERNPENASYNLLDVWIGHLSPPRPGSDEENTDSKPYWAEHACIFDNQPLQLRTLTKDCPY